MPTLLAGLTRLRIERQEKITRSSKVDVASAFKNVRIAHDPARELRYVLCSRPTIGWAASPGSWGIMVSSAEPPIPQKD